MILIGCRGYRCKCHVPVLPGVPAFQHGEQTCVELRDLWMADGWDIRRVFYSSWPPKIRSNPSASRLRLSSISFELNVMKQVWHHESGFQSPLADRKNNAQDLLGTSRNTMMNISHVASCKFLEYGADGASSGRLLCVLRIWRGWGIWVGMPAFHVHLASCSSASCEIVLQFRWYFHIYNIIYIFYMYSNIGGSLDLKLPCWILWSQRVFSLALKSVPWP